MVIEMRQIYSKGNLLKLYKSVLKKSNSDADFKSIRLKVFFAQ